MKKIAYALFSLSFLIFLISLAGFFFGDLETRTIYSSVNLTADTGSFDLEGSDLTFGKVALGGSSTRHVSFENTYPFVVDVGIEIEGDIGPLLSYEPLLNVPPGEKRNISFF